MHVENIYGKEKDKYKAPDVETYLECSRNSQKAHVAGTPEMRRGYKMKLQRL